MNFQEARTNMVLNQLRANRISNYDLVDIYENMQRENFYPGAAIFPPLPRRMTRAPWR